jgi:hypothetical protein
MTRGLLQRPDMTQASDTLTDRRLAGRMTRVCGTVVEAGGTLQATWQLPDKGRPLRRIENAPDPFHAKDEIGGNPSSAFSAAFSDDRYRNRIAGFLVA